MPKPKRLSNSLFLNKVVNDTIEIKISSVENGGKGAFASRDIPKGAILGNYMGEVCSRETNGDYVLYVSVHREYNGTIKKVELCIDAQNPKLSNWTRFINSVTNNKNDTNVAFFVYGEENQENVGVKTIKFIPKGHELFLDYGDEFF